MNKLCKAIEGFIWFNIYLIEVVIKTLTFTLVPFGVLGYILALIFKSLAIDVWNILFIATFILTLSIITIKDLKDKKLRSREKYNSAKYLFLKYVPYLILLPAIIPLLNSTWLQLSRHGAFHIGYINQILNGVALPENVVLPGFPANVYWLYHALLAAIVSILNIAPPLASTLLNLFALLGSLYWINKTLSLLNLKYKNPFITSCYVIFILFGLNLFASIHILLYYISEGNIFFNNFLDLLSQKTATLTGDQRLSNIYTKFLQFNGFPLGVLYFTLAFYSSIRILKSSLNLNNIMLLMLSIAGALAFHTTSGIFALGVIPLSVFITIGYINKGNLRAIAKSLKVSQWIIVFFTGLILFIPLLIHIFVVARALPFLEDTGIHYLYNLKSIISSTYPLVLFFLFALFLGFRQISSVKLLLCLTIIFGYILSFIIYLPDNNQYKFLFLAAIPFCMLIVLALDYLINSLNGKIRLYGKVILSLVLITCFLNIFFVDLVLINFSAHRDKTYYFKDKKIFLDKDIEYKGVLEWIRENTPTDIIVIIPLDHKNRSKIYTIAERLPYVVYGKGNIYAIGIEDYHNRLQNIKLFYEDKTPTGKKIEILEEFKKFNSEKPSILLIPKANIEKIIVNNEMLKLIYSDKEANIYDFKN